MSPPEPLVRVPPEFEEEFPDADALATECVLNMGLLAGAVMSVMSSVFRDAGLPSAAAFNVLTVVDGAGGSLPPSVIAERMMVTRPSITGVLDTLEKRELIRRVADPNDGRGRVAQITPRGHALVVELVPRMHRLERDLLSRVTVKEKRALLAVLATLQQQVREIAPDAEFTTPA
jgi:DNA-binding MarR family transcriptional regulator